MAHTGLQERKKKHQQQNSTNNSTNSSNHNGNNCHDAVCRPFSKQQSNKHPVARAAAAASAASVQDPAVKQVCSQLGAAKKETQHYMIGSLLFGGLLFAAGAATWSLPWLFVLFAVVCLPWRAYTYCKQKYAFYLIDFCYFVNIATVLYLLLLPDHHGLEALVYALSDGPLAGALVAWQCPWVFGSAEHTTSVLMHLLPGLALFAHRYHTPTGLRGLQGLRSTATAAAAAVLGGGDQQQQQQPGPVLGVVPPAEQPQHLVVWLVVAPLLFYITWQLLYFVIVQVVMRPYILQHGYETSYTCLARRAAKSNNIWNRLVRRGSIMRRVCVYGALQLAFTVICCSVFLPTYFYYWAAITYQVIKVAFPVYYGARYQCQKVPQHVFLKGIQQLDVSKPQQQQQTQPPQQQTQQQQQASDAAQVSHGGGGAAASAGAAAAAAAAGVELPVCENCRSTALQLRSCAAEVAAAAHPQQHTASNLQQPSFVM